MSVGPGLCSQGCGAHVDGGGVCSRCPLPPEPSLFAAQVEESDYDEETDSYSVVPRLVVVPAASEESAQLESGLIDSVFWPADDDDLEEWDEITGKPLNDKDVETLLTLVRKAGREVGKRRLKDREKGIRAHARNAHKFKARKLAELAGKLEAMVTVEEIEEDAAANEV